MQGRKTDGVQNAGRFLYKPAQADTVEVAASLHGAQDIRLTGRVKDLDSLKER